MSQQKANRKSNSSAQDGGRNIERAGVSEPDPGEQLWTVKEVAEYLRVKASWVRDHSNGKRKPTIPSIKLGGATAPRRYRRRDIDRVLRRLDSTAA